MRLAVFEPVFRGELGDGLVGVVGDLGQHVLEVVERIDAPLAAGLDDGEEDGATLATFPRGAKLARVAQEQCAGANELCRGRPAGTGKFRELGAFRLREGDFTL